MSKERGANLQGLDQLPRYFTSQTFSRRDLE